MLCASGPRFPLLPTQLPANEHLQYFSREAAKPRSLSIDRSVRAAKKEKEKDSGSGRAACSVPRVPGSRYCRRNISVTDLTCFPGPVCILLLFFFASSRLRVQTVQVCVCLKTHKTRGPGCILLLFFFAASRANCPGARLREDPHSWSPGITT